MSKMKGETKINADGFADAINGVLEEYQQDTIEKMNVCVKKSASNLAKKIKASAPQKSGRYAKGWTSKMTKGPRSKLVTDQYTVYNAKSPGLAHLLEFGHVKIVNGKVLGKTPAHPHIANAVDAAAEEFQNDVMKELKG